jgi:DNA-binding HxlR family transcriptional regulator
MPTPRRTVPVSALDAALHRVGDRWSLLLVEALLPGPQRFNELLDGLDGLAPNILSARLKALEAEGVLAARPYSQRPYRVAYVLTARGAELAGALRLLAHWGAQRSSARARAAVPLHHATCGSAVEARWYCPTCDRVVADDEAPDLDYV